MSATWVTAALLLIRANWSFKMKLVSSTYVTPSLIAKHINEQLEEHVFNGAMVFVSADIEYESLLPLLSLSCPYIGTTTISHSPSTCLHCSTFQLCQNSMVPIILGNVHGTISRSTLRRILNCRIAWLVRAKIPVPRSG